MYADCVGTSRNPHKAGMSFLDLFLPMGAPLKLRESGHQDALIIAGITKIAECEKEKEWTRKINVEGTLSLVRQLVNDGIKPVFFSSDLVFDGRRGLYTEESIPSPLNEYARQKVEVESRIKEICRDGNYLIVRLPKTFSINKGDGTLFDEMASILNSGQSFRAAYDQVLSPIYIVDVVRIVMLLQVKKATGIIHVCSPEVWSRYDLALALADWMGVDSGYIEKISLDDLQETFKRPKNTSMKADKMKRETGYQFAPITNYVKKTAENWRLETSLSTESRKSI